MPRKLLVSILCMISVSFPVTLLSSSAWAFEDGIVAVVDDNVITAKDLQDYLRGIYAQLRIENRSDQEIKEVMDEYQSKGINQLVEDRLILAEAKRQGMVIRSGAVEERMTEIKNKYASMDQLLAEINKEGVTLSEIRRKIEDQFKARYTVTKEVRDKVYVNPQEVTEYYNAHINDYTRRSRVYVQSVFVKSDADPTAARDKIQTALDKINAGQDFSEVSGQYSELPSIGEVYDDSLSPEFRKKIDLMWVGQVSDIITVPGGFYILKLTGRTPDVAPSLNEVKNEIYQKLFEIKFKTQFN
ncbi:MAG: peptidyl-prolyl cis-trans isomerase, partial [Candidatus Omnitrophota bacterium]